MKQKIMEKMGLAENSTQEGAAKLTFKHSVVN
jgi:hypothetical protein